jgi:hypothetical protein
MNILIILAILVLLYIVFEPCKYSFTSKSGRLFKARSTEVANLIEVIIYISNYLAKKINENDGKRFQSKLQNTSFIELINEDSQILAWNYDKGREIGIRVYDDNNFPYDADTIITSLFHELAHSLCKTVGHNAEWEEKNNYLQGFKDVYIEYLINNTFINK